MHVSGAEEPEVTSVGSETEMFEVPKLTEELDESMVTVQAAADQQHPFRREELLAAGGDFKATAEPINDLNDFIHACLTRLPQDTWLELSGDWPGGSFYLPGLTVNYLLNITTANLRQHLGDDWGRTLHWGNAVFRPEARLSRSDGTSSTWILVNVLGNKPNCDPGAINIIYMPAHPASIKLRNNYNAPFACRISNYWRRAAYRRL